MTKKDTPCTARAWTRIVLLAMLLFTSAPAHADWLLEIEEYTDFIKEQATRHTSLHTPAPQRETTTIRRRINRAAKFRPIIMEASRKYGVHPDFIQAVIKVESDFNPKAKSPHPHNAMGLMQLRAGTAAFLGVKNPWDPRQNVMGGTKYLKLLLVEFRSPRLALAGYNWGPTRLRQGRRRLPPGVHDYINKVFNEFKRLQYKEKKK